MREYIISIYPKLNIIYLKYDITRRLNQIKILFNNFPGHKPYLRSLEKIKKLSAKLRQHTNFKHNKD